LKNIFQILLPDSKMQPGLDSILQTNKSIEFDAQKSGTNLVFLVRVTEVDRCGFLMHIQELPHLERLKDELKRRIDYEDLLSRISVLAVEHLNLAAFLETSLEILGEDAGVSRTYLFELNLSENTMSNTYEWCAAGIYSQIDQLKSISLADRAWWNGQLGRRQVICYSNIDEIPDKATREIIISQGIKSILVVPLFVKSRYFGFMGFDDCEKYRKWPEEDVALLLSISRIISSVIERQQFQHEQLRLISQLNQAQKMESVGRLAGGVAHDFNNMLNVILDHCDLALEDMNTDGPAVKDLLEIRQAAVRSAELTGQLLAFARCQPVTPRVVNLNETLHGMLNMLKRLIGEDVALKVRLCEKARLIKIDPVQIDQILANLCVNARDAIDGVGIISIETACVYADKVFCSRHAGMIEGSYVRLSVSDNGCGMDEKTAACIFEPFFTTKPKDKGTGLGLATVYGIVKQNRGYIDVYSQPEVGSCFKVYFPVIDSEGEEPREGTEKSIIAEGCERILLTEDEPAILKITKRILERLGYKVTAVLSPLEALDEVKRNPGSFDLLITDIIMPEMNGRDLAEKIKEKVPTMKVLFMSGYTADIIAQHGILQQNLVFLQKPFSKESLAEKVREALLS
ncbi:MAG: response regulator, partial [Candidatus Riflebacteria bacterium]